MNVLKRSEVKLKYLKLALIVLLLKSLEACCPQKDYTKAIGPYEKAAAIMAENKAALMKYEKEFNTSGRDHYIFLVGKKEFTGIARQENNKDLNTILKLWDEDLLKDNQSSMWFFKNGNTYFQADECRDANDFIVYDGGEEIMIDVQSDIRKKRIKPNWIYMRMMK